MCTPWSLETRPRSKILAKTLVSIMLDIKHIVSYPRVNLRYTNSNLNHNRKPWWKYCCQNKISFYSILGLQWTSRSIQERSCILHCLQISRLRLHENDSLQLDTFVHGSSERRSGMNVCLSICLSYTWVRSNVRKQCKWNEEISPCNSTRLPGNF
jgi:hypothetical protein